MPYSSAPPLPLANACECAITLENADTTTEAFDTSSWKKTTGPDPSTPVPMLPVPPPPPPPPPAPLWSKQAQSSSSHFAWHSLTFSGPWKTVLLWPLPSWHAAVRGLVHPQ